MGQVEQVAKQRAVQRRSTRGTGPDYEAMSGAGEGIRTLDVLLGKQALYR